MLTAIRINGTNNEDGVMCTNASTTTHVRMDKQSKGTWTTEDKRAPRHQDDHTRLTT